MSRMFVPALLLGLSACTSSGGATPGHEFALDPGTQAALPDASTLRYLGVASDSRCPPDVHCIRAGDADVLFDFSAKGLPATRIVLNTERRREAGLGAWRLQLMALAPGARPRATLRVDQLRQGAAP